jgi:predicted RNA-binding protein with PUA-like domain
MNYWLVKSEPETYSWDKFVQLGKDHWDGVRNYAARNHLKNMVLGDWVLFYHSGDDRQVVGIAQVSREHYPDPSTDDPQWVAVELTPLKPLPKPVTLKTIKADPDLQHIALVRQSRLSVMPLEQADFERIIAYSEA